MFSLEDNRRLMPDRGQAGKLYVLVCPEDGISKNSQAALKFPSSARLLEHTVREYFSLTYQGRESSSLLEHRGRGGAQRMPQGCKVKFEVNEWH